MRESKVSSKTILNKQRAPERPRHISNIVFQPPARTVPFQDRAVRSVGQVFLIVQSETPQHTKGM